MPRLKIDPRAEVRLKKHKVDQEAMNRREKAQIVAWIANLASDPLTHSSPINSVRFYSFVSSF